VEGDLQRTLGANLRAVRHQRSLSQEAFAEVLGVHRTYLGGIERGERNLTLRSVERLAERLGVDAFSLLSAAGSGRRRPTTARGVPRRR
jgi:transcriptional regulator with XRE-family HTH domain